MSTDAITGYGRKEVNLALKKMAATKSKAVRARSLVLTIISCLAFVAVSLIIFRHGIAGSIKVLTDAREKSRAVHQAVLGDINTEVRMRHKLTKLTSGNLPEHYPETHTQCLVRGAYYVDVYFWGYPMPAEIQEPALEWVQRNCDRLTLAPSTHTTTPQQTVQRVSWAQQARSIVVQIKHNLGYFLHTWLGYRWTEKMVEKPEETPVERSEAAEPTAWEPSLPRDFRLSKCEEPPCRYSFAPTKGKPAPLNINVSLDKFEDTIMQIQTKITMFRDVIQAVDRLYAFLLLIEALFCIALLCSKPTADELSLLHSDWQCFVRMLSNQPLIWCFAQFALNIFSGICIRAPVQFSTNTYSWLAVIGFSNLMTFVMPHHMDLPTIWQLSGALQELTPLFVAEVRRLFFVKRTMAATIPKLTVQVNPHTSLQEDIAATVEAIRAEGKYIKFESPHIVDEAEAKSVDTEYEDANDMFEPKEAGESVGLHFGSEAGSDWEDI
jgi:hypothetical protein